MEKSGGDAPVATWVAIPFALGFLAGGLHDATGVGAPIAVGVALAALAWTSATTARAHLAAIAAGLACGALAAAWTALPPAPDDVARLVGRDLTAIEGTIVQSDRLGSRAALVVDVARVRTRRRTGHARGLVAMTIAHAARPWPIGTGVRVVGKLRRPRNFLNPGGYDHEGALARRGIHATLFLWDDAHVESVALGSPDRDQLLGRVRVELADRIAARTSEPVRGYLTAVLLGATQSLDRETRTALTRTGLAHVVSVSGFHVAVAAGTCFVLLRWLLLRAGSLALHVDVGALAAVLGLVPVGAYAAIAGGSVPATRSFLTYPLVLAALACGRRPDGLRTLALLAVLLSIRAPDMAADVSFELSFVSVAALFMVAERARRRGAAATSRTWWRRAVATSIRTSLAATIATAPLTAWHFQQISLIAPIANLVTLPLLGPATLLPGLAALPLTALAPATGVASWIADRLLDAAAWAAGLGLAAAVRLAALPGAAVTTPMPSLLELAIAYTALALWWTRAHAGEPRRIGPWRRAAVALVTILGVAGTSFWMWERCCNPTLRVTFLSVGQGDAAVVELPRGGVLVVDGGGFPGDFDPGERVIAPFLRSRKILHVDALALSHPQLDHYGGLAHLAETFAPNEIWWNGARGTGARFARLQAALTAAGTRPRVLRRGTTIRRDDDVEIDVLHPGDPLPGNVNDGSLVLRLRFGTTSVLFTGDIERGAEHELLTGARDGLRSIVLKVPHHGSATSTSAAWLAAVAPRVAVVSSGADNRFGFPAPAVVRRLRASGATVWNTAEHGAVRVVSDGHALSVTAMRPWPGKRFEFPQLLW